MLRGVALTETVTEAGQFVFICRSSWWKHFNWSSKSDLQHDMQEVIITQLVTVKHTYIALKINNEICTSTLESGRPILADGRHDYWLPGCVPVGREVRRHHLAQGRWAVVRHSPYAWSGEAWGRQGWAWCPGYQGTGKVAHWSPVSWAAWGCPAMASAGCTSCCGSANIHQSTTHYVNHLVGERYRWMSKGAV